MRSTRRLRPGLGLVGVVLVAVLVGIPETSSADSPTPQPDQGGHGCGAHHDPDERDRAGRLDAVAATTSAAAAMMTASIAYVTFGSRLHRLGTDRDGHELKLRLDVIA